MKHKIPSSWVKFKDMVVGEKYHPMIRRWGLPLNKTLASELLNRYNRQKNKGMSPIRLADAFFKVYTKIGSIKNSFGKTKSQVKISYTSPRDLDDYVRASDTLNDKSTLQKIMPMMGGTNSRNSVTPYNLEKNLVPSVKTLMNAYMEVAKYHCSSYPHIESVKKKDKEILKQIEEIHSNFKNNKKEFTLYNGQIKNEYFRNAIHSKFAEFHKMVIPLLSIKHFIIPHGSTSKTGGVSWNVAENTHGANTDYDYSNGRNPLALMRLDDSVKEQLTGGDESCIIS